jgi:receptor protein-tyrosine kinase
VVVATAVAALAIGLLGTLLIEPVYTASTVMRFTPRSGSTDYATLEYAVRLKNTYADLAESGPSLDVIESRLGIDVPSRELRDAISVEFPSNNELLNVVVRYRDPVLAAGIANTVSELLIEESQSSRSGRAFTLELLETAEPPSSGSLTNSLIAVGFGVILSLIAGLGLAFLLESIDTRLHTVKQVEELTEMPVLIQVPTFRGAKSAYIPGDASGEAEAFRQLRTLLSMSGHGETHKLISVTSAVPGEGKSLVAANLARSFAMLGQKVVLVDCDLRRPRLHDVFRLPNDVGLSTVLNGQADVAAATQFAVSHNLHVLTSGPLPPNPAELLSSPGTAELWRRLGEQFDVVLLDSPALLAVTDATILAKQADAVLFVVRYAISESENVRRAYGQLTAVQANVVGVVANGAGQNQVYQYYARA